MVVYRAVTVGGRPYCLLPYVDELILGSVTPQVAVPYFESVEEALEEVQGFAAGVAPWFTEDGYESLARFGALKGRGRDEVQLAAPAVFFRGQANTRYTPLPTAVRMEHVEESQAALDQRRVEEARVMKRLATERSDSSLPPWSDLQLRAAARHHGAPSRLLDYTFDPRVAAAFAHPRFTEEERRSSAPLGMIYALDLRILNDLFGIVTWGSRRDGGAEVRLVNGFTRFQLPYLGFDEATGQVGQMELAIDRPYGLPDVSGTVTTTLVPGLRRIRAQKGLFLEFATDVEDDLAIQLWFWLMLDLASHKWCFRRRDEAYTVLGEDGEPVDLFAG